MQFKLFVVSVTDTGEALGELNRFLRSHRVLEETHELIAGKNGNAWHSAGIHNNSHGSTDPWIKE